MNGMQNFIQKYKLISTLHVIDVMYNVVPHVKITNDVANSVSQSAHLLTLCPCDVLRSTDDVLDQTTPLD